MKKIIALDVDGTLYNNDKNITPATKASLLRAQQKGCILVLASGRLLDSYRLPTNLK
ncbi:hydroxymethylpyrimidine pyrophosphatase-like HAD family hydrolase [Pectinatus haikarae]|uniref:Hydroxymethylpyrimidine pyrophosphatase-like HAD family hydrolase n=1 Tax=Pectinatus haikarae TaxID=349096 RepID=A0ABT9YB08_9FIRM|nr:HAD hydrolase family protein [Pectinatus haikarae]MDQ0204299.1 hydroxymethylpyrimidine pyrophosphatase-like HAD family hydrolase [Pectinatus haikarae]